MTSVTRLLAAVGLVLGLVLGLTAPVRAADQPRRARSVTDVRGDQAHLAGWRDATRAERARGDLLGVTYALRDGRVRVTFRLARLAPARRDYQTAQAQGRLRGHRLIFATSNRLEVGYYAAKDDGTPPRTCRGARATRDDRRRSLTISVPMRCLPRGHRIYGLTSSAQSVFLRDGRTGDAISSDRTEETRSLKVR